MAEALEEAEMSGASFRVSAVLPAAPEQVFKAWMSSKGHGAMTGGTAKVTAKIGAKFSAWDGYITGKTLELVPGQRIVQAWRTTDFPEDAEDSRIEISLKKERKGTRITLVHTEVPRKQAAEYKRGWVDFYFRPMKLYFAEAKKV